MAAINSETVEMEITRFRREPNKDEILATAIRLGLLELCEATLGVNSPGLKGPQFGQNVELEILALQFGQFINPQIKYSALKFEAIRKIDVRSQLMSTLIQDHRQSPSLSYFRKNFLDFVNAFKQNSHA
jgi:hypothetical protein